ncbi:MAG: aspartate aminotransferase family protein [Flavobacteriales bacterium CG_4_10_14_0_2_um_filter_32_8]|nr:MAG: aspartate aminotransferase family protein [Flavobacteriales bacterium CG_4_10_14_0_2_um_filter_32_8]PJB15861.1 MAG: aspartate aminotransferase family protein [Flavobacteriales bacterium CG_4_9_14_3_um_filter_32_8]
MYWEKLSHDEITARIDAALAENLNYKTKKVLGVPASYLDEEQFYDDAPFLEDSPFMKTLIANPNHIGCHTLNEDSEPFFKGTQKIEVELIKLCAEEILGGENDAQDGYVASGGTEANIQALWIYRNYFIKEYKANVDEIAVVYSQDSHYSMPKGANLLNISSIVIQVEDNSRMIVQADLEQRIALAAKKGINYFIVIMNMSTTMFGSVDDMKRVTDFFESNKLNYKVHVDGAFGGFIYPFTNDKSTYSFTNNRINSFTLDGHKMLQTPYGTGIFIIRKGYMKYALTEEANYVQGKDYTICGSRSGANAISVWMMLKTHGSDGLKVKMRNLADKASLLCKKLEKMGVAYYHNPFINIITIRGKFISPQLAKKYSLVPNVHDATPDWYKIVVMDHVKQGVLDNFIIDLKSNF